jgi:hypothetical protein
MSKKKRNKQPKWFDDYVPEEVANSSLFKFTVVIGSKQKIVVDMRADLEVDYNVIQDQLEDTPSEFAYWAAIYSELKMQVAKIERKIKARRGKLVDKIVKDATEASVRLTDKQTQAIVEADSDLGLLEAKQMLMNKHCGKMYFMVEAIRMKSDNLRSLAGFARIEYADQK